jgi:hypothetical protein
MNKTAVARACAELCKGIPKNATPAGLLGLLAYRHGGLEFRSLK